MTTHNVLSNNGTSVLDIEDTRVLVTFWRLSRSLLQPRNQEANSSNENWLGRRYYLNPGTCNGITTWKKCRPDAYSWSAHWQFPESFFQGKDRTNSCAHKNSKRRRWGDSCVYAARIHSASVATYQGHSDSQLAIQRVYPPPPGKPTQLCAN